MEQVPFNLRQLANALERQAEQLQISARLLREAAEELEKVTA